MRELSGDRISEKRCRPAVHEEVDPSSRVTRLEEHIAVIADPVGEYVTHFTPSSGKSLDIFKELHDIAGELGGEVVVIVADGTTVNTGKKAGVCRLFEIFEGKPVHWFVCQLHSNELNLRELFTKLDGSTTGPKSFSGPLGKQPGKSKKCQ